MNQAAVFPSKSPAQATSGHLSSKAAFYLLASIVVSFLAGSSAPTPLYPLYQAQWGFSPIIVTVIFGIYAIAVLVALLFAGRLSDYLGRRPVLLTAIAAQILTMILLATASGLTQLLLARVLQGLSAPAHERAGVLSIVFIVSYLALGAPAVAAGARLAQHGDIFATAREFGTVVMALAMVAVLAANFLSVVRRRFIPVCRPA